MYGRRLTGVFSRCYARNLRYAASLHIMARQLIQPSQTLYVAVTRCRANLRIIEENKATADLIVDFWTTKVPKPLIETVRPGDKDVVPYIP